MLFSVAWDFDSWTLSLQDVFFPGCEIFLSVIMILLLDTLHALYVCVAVMRVQNVVELFTLFIVAVCAHPHPPQQPLNSSKHEPGAV